MLDDPIQLMRRDHLDLELIIQLILWVSSLVLCHHVVGHMLVGSLTRAALNIKEGFVVLLAKAIVTIGEIPGIPAKLICLVVFWLANGPMVTRKVMSGLNYFWLLDV